MCRSSGACSMCSRASESGPAPSPPFRHLRRAIPLFEVGVTRDTTLVAELARLVGLRLRVEVPVDVARVDDGDDPVEGVLPRAPAQSAPQHGAAHAGIAGARAQ
eukprot:gene15129-biopygen210